MNKTKGLLIAIVFIALLFRTLNLSFPFFTSDEARVAYRGHTLSRSGEDELGRKWPLIFNSSQDYQLPLISYITSIGEIIPGPYDITARLPFILIGTLLVFTSFFITRIITGYSNVALINAFLIATSPALIFLSKTPNDQIVLTFLVTLFFLLLTTKHYRKKLVLTATVITAILMILTSKTAWFIIPPFAYIAFFFRQEKLPGSKLTLSVLTAVCLLILASFMLIPQGLRSLRENNFTLLSDVTVTNGINYLRGEGLQAHQSPYLEKILFNKTHFLTAGFLHWLSYLQPNLQFTQMDSTGVNSYSGSGAWVLVLIIPFFIGLIYLLKFKDRLLLLLLGAVVSLIYPGLFVTSKIDYSLIVLCLPFIGIIISLGLFKIKKNLMFLFIALTLLGIGLNSFDLSTEKIKVSNFRPEWIKPIVLQANLYANKEQVLVSDDILFDAVPFFQLYGGYEFKKPGVTFPYLLTVNKSTNLKFLLNESKFNFCKDYRKNIFLITKRDFDKMNGFNRIHNLKEPKSLKTFTDDLGKEKVYLLSENICLK